LLRYDFSYDDQEHATRYTTEREKLVNSELPQFEAQIAHQRTLAEQELVENFIHRLREQIEEARQQLDYLNITLAQLRFGGERYELITQSASGLRAMYDMVMDSQSVLGATRITVRLAGRFSGGGGGTVSVVTSSTIWGMAASRSKVLLENNSCVQMVTISSMPCLTSTLHNSTTELPVATSSS